MQVIKNKSDNIVYYMFEDGEWVSLTDILMTTTFKALDMNDVNQEHELGATRPDLFVGGAMSYTDPTGWLIVDQVAYDEAYSARDDSYRAQYEDNMTNVMLTAQVDALGDPAVHRYTQGMTRLTHLVNAREQGATLDQEEIDFIDGSKLGLDYQEANAISFSTAKADLLLLTGQAILDYPMPDFTMSPVISIGYQPYLDYLNLGHI